MRRCGERLYMKDDEDVNDRLARLRVDQNGPPRGGRQVAASRVAVWWRRFLHRRRGDALLAMTAVLIAGVVIAAIAVLVISLASGGGDKEQASAAIIQRTPAAVARSSPSLAPTTAATQPPAVATAQPAGRQDCAAIRGTSYQSEAERAFFQQNCLEPAEEPAPAANAGQPTAAPPAATPVPGGSDASNAIGLAVDWIAQHASPSYTTDAGSCNALQASGHWVVTCNARLAGCQGSICEATVSVCVLSDLTGVRPSGEC
jgi:hypothetical protein